MPQPQRTPASQDKPDPNEKLVRIFETEQESEALVVKGLLDSSGIENDLAPAELSQEAFPGLSGAIILVREEDAPRARSVIEEYRLANAAEASDETDEDATEDLPAKP